jgi:FMN phosphatase YigB (HAD superfamily)
MSPHTQQFIVTSSATGTIASLLDLPLFANAYPQQFTPKNTAIAFDLHGVLFQSSYYHIAKILLRCPHKLRLISLFVNIPMVRTVLTAIFKKYVIEQCINTLTAQHAIFTPIRPTAIAVANAQKINHDTLEIIQKLHARGYKLIVFSNIGEESISLMRKQFPTIFSYFSHVIHTSAGERYIAKPSLRAFDKLLAHIAPETNVILIDDVFKNIKQAHALGLYPVPFFNASLLKDTLCYLKVL